MSEAGAVDLPQGKMMVRNLRVITLFLIVLLTTVAHSATVEWNGFYFYDWDETEASMTAGQYGACAYIRWFNSRDVNGNLIWKSDRGDYMEMNCAWMQVAVGDLIDEAFVRSRDGYFYRRNLYGAEMLRSDYDIIFTGEEDVFLGVAVARNYDSPSDVLYGWAQFHLDTDGTVSMITSALDIDGDGIRVGSTPEPSSALLLLVGGALLALKRPRIVRYISRTCQSMLTGVML